MSKVFLYKNNSEGRDCCAYIEDRPMRFECNHYFGSVILHGPNYFNSNFANYNNIKTILTEDEYSQLIEFNVNIRALGYGICKEDDRYKRGIELCKEIQPIFDKLLSDENAELFEEIQEEEKEYLMDKYNLSDDEVDEIFDNYNLEYRDREIVSCVFEDSSELGYEEAFGLGYINDSDSIQSKYFDFERFGEDLLEEEQYLKLSDGRIVCLNY